MTNRTTSRTTNRTTNRTTSWTTNKTTNKTTNRTPNRTTNRPPSRTTSRMISRTTCITTDRTTIWLFCTDYVSRRKKYDFIPRNIYNSCNGISKNNTNYIIQYGRLIVENKILMIFKIHYWRSAYTTDVTRLFIYETYYTMLIANISHIVNIRIRFLILIMYDMSSKF